MFNELSTETSFSSNLDIVASYFCSILKVFFNRICINGVSMAVTVIMVTALYVANIKHNVFNSLF